MPPRFSIITPTWNRADGRLQRCIASVQAQTFTDFEHIIVDDGSTDDTAAVVGAVKDPRVRYVYIEHGGRVQARNAGMRRACGVWVAHLDSDDCFSPEYLNTFTYHIEKEPDIRVFCCGSVYSGMVKEDGKHIVPKWTKIRRAWMPPVDTNGVHSELFRSGRVGTGMFCFKRSCLNTIGLLPDDWINPYQVADGIDEWLGVEPGSTGYGSGKPGSHHARAVGNPWGEDHCLYQKLALNFRISKIEAALYVQYVR